MAKNTIAFGTIASLVIKSNARGAYAYVTIAAKTFQREVLVYQKKQIEALKQLGTGANIWVLGQLEMQTRKNETGGEYQVEVLRVQVLKSNDLPQEDKAAPAANEDAAAETPAEAPAADAPEADAPAADAQVIDADLDSAFA